MIAKTESAKLKMVNFIVWKIYLNKNKIKLGEQNICLVPCTYIIRQSFFNFSQSLFKQLEV